MIWHRNHRPPIFGKTGIVHSCSRKLGVCCPAGNAIRGRSGHTDNAAAQVWHGNSARCFHLSIQPVLGNLCSIFSEYRDIYGCYCYLRSMSAHVRLLSPASKNDSRRYPYHPLHPRYMRLRYGWTHKPKHVWRYAPMSGCVHATIWLY